ncbi:hypothetical protein [Geodermatophilus ruber]|uniref:Uncharacterized protein n=1 Tax=Geodermatophilus ruber TaxID=504800 RepID=A0A1I4HN37_9ACTN|nr:hypothetical protein [Geodermatophilus ruber]SFL43544.1 hypothetical protein SAMN04488085_11144 [Geodermatophilus ruber]
MTVLPLPVRGRWVWDAHDKARAVRVSTHAAAGLLNLSLWRDETCVGTVKLRPDEVARLVAALTDGLAELADAAGAPAEAPAPEAARLAAVEQRVAGLESRTGTPGLRRAGPAVAAAVGRLRRRLR